MRTKALRGAYHITVNIRYIFDTNQILQDLWGYALPNP